MRKTISILLADSSDDFLTLLSEHIEKEEDMLIVGTANDGEKAVDLVRQLEPSVLIMDILLRKLDGIGIIKELKKRGFMPHTIVVSAFFNDKIASELSTLGANYCFPKPCRVSELISRIRECVQPVGQGEKMCGYEADIAEALINFGMMPHLQGYRYSREAVRRNLLDSSVLHGVTKILYPDLAKAFHTTPKCVERSIRNAIESAWKKGDAAQRNDYFGQMTMLLTKRPTNSELISMISEFVLLKQSSGRDTDAI